MIRLVLAGLLSMAAAPAASAAGLTLAWNPNSEGNLSGYVVSYGTAAGAQTQTVNVTPTITRIRIENPTTELYVQSVLPRWHTRTDAVRRLNDGIESLACGNDATWIDLRPLFDQGDGTMDLDLAPDALHPNAEGYRRWVEVISPMVRSAG
jgi:lysophospholipase L1-like esterase